MNPAEDPATANKRTQHNVCGAVSSATCAGLAVAYAVPFHVSSAGRLPEISW
jgi:hypothetical protein